MKVTDINKFIKIYPNNIHFSQNDAKFLSGIGTFDVIIYLRNSYILSPV